MTTIPATILSQHLFERGTVPTTWEFNRGLASRWQLLMSIIGLAAPSIAEIGSFYVTVP